MTYCLTARTRFAFGSYSSGQSDLTTFDAARIAIDWPSFTSTLTEREKWMVEELAVGSTKTEIAREAGLSSARISQIFADIADLYKDYLGTPGFEVRARRDGRRRSGRQRWGRLRGSKRGQGGAAHAERSASGIPSCSTIASSGGTASYPTPRVDSKREGRAVAPRRTRRRSRSVRTDQQLVERSVTRHSLIEQGLAVFVLALLCCEMHLCCEVFLFS